MSDKTCWLVDEENGIATDGKRYWCAKKSWKCCEGMIKLNHAVEVLAEQIFNVEHNNQVEYKTALENIKDIYRNEAKGLLK